MGCIKSKHRDPTQNSSSAPKAGESLKKSVNEKVTLMSRSAEGPPQVSPVLLDYAQRLSEEIMARAVEQWIELDSRYRDIPYIDLP